MCVMSKPKAKRKPIVSMRAKKYIRNKVAGMSDYQAAIKAGYKHNTAINPKKNIEKPIVKQELAKLMDKAGLTDEYLIAKAKEGLEEANKIIGTQDNFVEVPDYAVRHKYLETALRLKGHNSNKDDQPNVQVNILNSLKDDADKYKVD